MVHGCISDLIKNKDARVADLSDDLPHFMHEIYGALYCSDLSMTVQKE